MPGVFPQVIDFFCFISFSSQPHEKRVVLEKGLEVPEFEKLIQVQKDSEPRLTTSNPTLLLTTYVLH